MRFLLLALTYTSVAAQGYLDNLERVPPDMVQRSRLIERNLGFSLAAPQGWGWYRPTDHRDWYLTVSPLGRDYFSVHVSDRFKASLTPTAIDLAMEDLGRALDPLFVEIQDPVYQRRSKPLPDSWYVTFTTVNRDDERVAHQAVFTKADRLIMIHAAELEATRAGNFEAFAHTLLLLVPETSAAVAAADPADEAPHTPVIERPRQRKLPPKIIAAALLLVLVAVGTLVLMRKGARRSPTGAEAQPDLETLRTRLRTHGESIDLWEQYWDMACAQASRDDIGLAGRRLLEHALRIGDLSRAETYWHQLHTRTGADTLSAGLGNKLAEGLLQTGARENAARILETGIMRQSKVPAAALLDALELALSLDGDLARRLDARLERQPLITEAEKKRRTDLQVRLNHPAPGPAPAAPPRVQVVGLTDQDEAAVHLVLGDAAKALPRAQIKAVAVGLIAAPDTSAYLVIDLALDPLRTAGCRVFRTTSRDLPLRTLVPDAPSAQAALRRIISQLIQHPETVPWPDAERAVARYPRFTDLAAFERAAHGAATGLSDARP